MYNKFLRMAIGPHMTIDTSDTGFYDLISQLIYGNNSIPELILKSFGRVFNKNLSDFNKVDKLISDIKDEEQVLKLFNDSSKNLIAVGLLAHFPDEVNKNSILKAKIKELLTDDPFYFLIYLYFTYYIDNNLGEFKGQIEEKLEKNLKFYLYFADIIKDIDNYKEDFNNIEKLLIEKGNESDKSQYYSLLYHAGYVPINKELNKYDYLNKEFKKAPNPTITNNIEITIAKYLDHIDNDIVKNSVYKLFDKKEKTDKIKLMNSDDRTNVFINNIIYKYCELNGITADSDKADELRNSLKNLVNDYRRATSGMHKFTSFKGNKIVKAYTRYYIKNFLPQLVRHASPETLPVVVENGVQEVQNLLYGDNQIMDFNNPVITNQIKNDITDAVNNKDLLSGGAADGMSIEEIAKKWSPIYNIPYQQMLDILKTQEQAGSIVEQEHSNNLEVAKEIARDHLSEAPDYYSHLENMEESFPAENIAVKPLPEPENMDLKTLENPLPKEHVCDGSCGGNCKCHVQVEEPLDNAPDGTIVPIKPQTVEDKLDSIGGNVLVTIVSEPQEVQPLTENEMKSMDFINGIAASIKR